MMMGIVYYSDIGFNTVLKRGAKAGALSQGFQGASPHGVGNTALICFVVCLSVLPLNLLIRQWSYAIGRHSSL